MKSFADWTQELAEAQQGPKPEPELNYALMDGAEECEACSGKGKITVLGSPHEHPFDFCEGTGRVDEVKCSGCDRYGAPNYAVHGSAYYYCGGAPWCCP